MQVFQHMIDQINLLAFSTSRLHVHKLRNEDKLDCLKHEQDRVLLKYIKDVPTPDEAELLVEKSIAPWSGEEGQWVTLAIINKTANNYMGELFFRFESVEFKRIEIGFRLATKYHQQGFVSEALQALKAELTEKIAPIKLVGYCVAENTASMKTMQKLGMVQEGLLRKHSTLNGVWHDERVFGLVMEP